MPTRYIRIRAPTLTWVTKRRTERAAQEVASMFMGLSELKHFLILIGAVAVIVVLVRMAIKSK